MHITHRSCRIPPAIVFPFLHPSLYGVISNLAVERNHNFTGGKVFRHPKYSNDFAALFDCLSPSGFGMACFIS